MPFISKTDLKKLVANNQIDLVFEILLVINDRTGNKELYNQVILLHAKYDKLKRDIRANVIRHEDKNVDRGQLTTGLLELIDEMPSDQYEIDELLYKKWKLPLEQAVSRFRMYVFSIVLVGAVLLYLFYQKSCAANPRGGGGDPRDTSGAIPRVYTPQPLDTISKKASRAVVNLTFTSPRLIVPENSSAVIGGNDTIPLAYIDNAYMDGKASLAGRLADACAYSFEIKNPSTETISVQHFFVKLYNYRPLPAQIEYIHIQPFEDAPVAYILMGTSAREGTNIYRNSFYWLEDEVKSAAGLIKIPPGGTAPAGVRVNAKKTGVYTFRIGAMYYSEKNDSLVARFVTPETIRWVFNKYPD